jgi:hypothetical protein
MRQWLFMGQTTINCVQVCVCEYVCARETAGKVSWLWQKSSMLLMHQRLATKEKGWRGMYSCSDGIACQGVNTMIQGIA